jgi:hypothetical protein
MKLSVVAGEQVSKQNMKQNFPFLNFHAMLLQVLRLGYSGKRDEGRAENFISTQEIELLVCHRILHEFEKNESFFAGSKHW